MIAWKLFKNKYFLTTVFLIALVAAIYSFVINNAEENILKDLPIVECKEFRDTISYPSILVITDLKDAKKYQDYFSGKVKEQNFKSYAILDGTKVQVIDTFDGNLYKIKIHNSSKTTAYNKCWIWHEFISETN